MSKAILILDEMPENCLYCKLSYDNCYCRMTGVNRSIFDYYEKRPDWCPLRPIPQKVKFYSGNSEWDDGYQRGIADVLRVIEGSES